MAEFETYPVQEFLNYLTFQKRYSPHTIISYQNDLTGFFGFIFLEYQSIEVKQISASMVRTWLASLKENKAASKTINRKISALKSFFKYLLKMGVIETSPVSSVTALKVNRRLPSFIEQKDMDVLFNEVSFPSTWEGKMNFMILEIFYQTGIRISELINLREHNIDKSSGTLKVLGKGNKERIIPINNQLIKLLEDYLLEKRKEFPESSNIYLFVGKSGKMLYPKYVYNMVKMNLGKVSTNERKSPHVLRHTFATHLTNNGAPINAIKELLGHSSLAATQVYTHNSIEKLKEVHKLAHPKS